MSNADFDNIASLLENFHVTERKVRIVEFAPSERPVGFPYDAEKVLGQPVELKMPLTTEEILYRIRGCRGVKRRRT